MPVVHIEGLGEGEGGVGSFVYVHVVRIYEELAEIGKCTG